MASIEAQPRRCPANRLRELRLASGLSRAEVCVAIARDSQTLWAYENQRRPIPDDIKETLANLFGVSIPWLMCWENEATAA